MSDDRTSEFFSLARSLPDGGDHRFGGGGQSSPLGSSTSSYPGGNRYGNNNNNNRSNSSASQQQIHQQQQQLQNPAYSELRSFHKTAADISRDICATSTMLSELAQLVKQSGSSLFGMDDHADRINGLVLRIKSNIENLHVRLE